MNIGVHSVLVSSEYMPSSGIAGSYSGFIPTFLRNLCTFSRVAVSVYIPTSDARALPFSTPSPAFICRLFDDGHSDWCEVVYHCSFDLHFSNNE